MPSKQLPPKAYNDTISSTKHDWIVVDTVFEDAFATHPNTIVIAE